VGFMFMNIIIYKEKTLLTSEGGVNRCLNQGYFFGSSP
jgi:hypothetical protein